MTSQHESHAAHEHRAPWWRSRGSWVLLGFLAVAGYFLLTEHTAHVLGALPWLLLLACPLMHLFMHHGHGGHRHGGLPDDQPNRGGQP
jgi:hypothetical protein